MSEPDKILVFAEKLIHRTTDTYCSELQRRILQSALQDERKTYDQLAEECAYSARYVKQDVAPKLWQLLSQAIGEKVTKANARMLLDVASKRDGAGFPAVQTVATATVQRGPDVWALPASERSPDRKSVV